MKLQNKWRAYYYTINKKQIVIGQYNTEKDAADALKITINNSCNI
jgi:hypothetical protein